MPEQNLQKQSVKQIRRRLFGMLMVAFSIVILLTIGLLMLIFVAMSLKAPSESGPFAPSALRDALRVYYISQGSWDGVESFAVKGEIGSQSDFASEWQRVVLLDASGRVLIDHGYTDTDQIGQLYESDLEAAWIPIKVGNQQMGTLVFIRRSLMRSFAFLFGLIPAGMVIAFFVGILTLIIGMLLMRRVVYPLSNMIATARDVASGDLSARVPVSGSSDLRSLIDSFNQMAASLQQNDLERRNMLADIAHELRTPLSIMRGRLEGIVDGVYEMDETQIAPALEEVYLLDNLVEDLRLLTLVETHQLPLVLDAIDLSDVAQYTAGLFEAQAQEKSIKLVVQHGDDLPLVMADSQRIGQVIGNLLSNALRYVPEGGEVHLYVKTVEDGVAVLISDNGPGVSDDDLGHLFDRFWRAEKSRSRAAGGAGLGLAIVKQLIEAHQGCIWAENQPKGGLKISFVLPEIKS